MWRQSLRASAHATFVCNDSEYFLRHRRKPADLLAKAGIDVTILAGGAPLKKHQAGDWTYVHLNVQRFRFDPVRDPWLFVSSLREIVRNRPRYMHLITLKPAIFSGLAAVAARLVGLGPERIVVTLPGLGRLMAPGSMMQGAGAGLSRQLVERVLRFLSERPGVFFTFETASDRNFCLARGIVRENSSYVINGAGVDAGSFRPREGDCERPIMRVVFASRLLRAKGLAVFLEVARRLRRRADVEFVVAGMAQPGDPDAYLLNVLRTEPCVTFLGEVDDMPDLLRSADLVCLPTRYGEGIPRVLIEAAACGLPCIATSLDGCSQIVSDGVSGTLIPVASEADMIDSLTMAIERYAVDPALRRRHGAAARAVFRSGGFSEEITSRRILEILTDGVLGAAGSFLQDENGEVLVERSEHRRSPYREAAEQNLPGLS